MVKSKYPTHVEPYLSQITEWVAEFQPESAICDRLGLAVGTWEEHKNKNPELREAIRQGHVKTVQLAESALFKLVMGFETTEEEYEHGKDVMTGKDVAYLTKSKKKKVPPNISAIQFLLKSRAPEIYNDQLNVKVSGGIEASIANMSSEDLAKAMEELADDDD